MTNTAHSIRYLIRNIKKQNPPLNRCDLSIYYSEIIPVILLWNKYQGLWGNNKTMEKYEGKKLKKIVPLNYNSVLSKFPMYQKRQ